jgi:hypothetical protein
MSLRSPEPLACEEAEQWLVELAASAEPLDHVVATLSMPVGTDHRRAARAVAAAAWLVEEDAAVLPHLDARTIELVTRVLREVLALPAWERRWLRPSERASARQAVQDILAALASRARG